MAQTANRNLWIDYLRSFLTVLVVAHHSSLAYTTFAYFDKATYNNSTAPIVDNARWVGMDIFENFNDIFFMSLMFLISGLFVYKSLQKKGTKQFLIDRIKRLGIPFIIAVSFIIPLAYIPSYLVGHHFGWRSFTKDFLINEQWPVGPPWFIWILLLFNVVAIFIPSKFYLYVADRVKNISQKPLSFFIACFIVLTIVYTPISLYIGQYKWTGIGPFDFQENRFFLYFIFFLFGVCLGRSDWENYMFNGNKLLNKSWIFWAILLLYFICSLTCIPLLDRLW